MYVNNIHIKTTFLKLNVTGRPRLYDKENVLGHTIIA